MNKKNPKTIKFKSVAVSFVLLSAVFAVVLNYAFSQAYIQDVTEPWLTFPTQEASYVIGQYNSTHYYAKNHTGYGTSANKGYEWLDTVCSDVVNNAVTSTSNAGGGMVLIKSGTYQLTDSIYVPSNVTLAGEGMDSTVLIGDGNVGTFSAWDGYIMNENYAGSLDENIVIRDLTLNANQSSWAIGYRGFHFRPVRNVKVIRCKVFDVSGWGISFYGLVGQRSSVCSVISSEVHTCKYDCVEMVGFAGEEFINGYVADSHFSHADGGTSCYNAKYVTIEGNHFVDLDGCAGSGTNHISIPIQGNSEFITVTGNTFAHDNLRVPNDAVTDKMNGLGKHAGVQHVTVTGNVFNFWSNESRGLMLSGADNYTITGNVFLRNQASGTWGIALGDNNIFEGNIIKGNITSAPMFVADHNNTIVNNLFIDTGKNYDACRINGDNNRIIGNRFKDCTKGLGINDANDNIIESNIFQDVTTKITITASSNDTVVRWNDGYKTENTGLTVDKANGGTIAHGLVGTPDVVTLTCLNATYDSVGVLVYWDHANSDATNISIDIYWTNGTAISDAVIAVSWNAEYTP